MENFKSLASRWDSNQVLKKPTGTTHPSLTKLPQCHAAQTSGNDQNKVDSSEFSIVTLNVSSGERHKKRDPRAQEIKISWDFSVCLVIWKLSDEHGRLISGRRKSWSAASYLRLMSFTNANSWTMTALRRRTTILAWSFVHPSLS